MRTGIYFNQMDRKVVVPIPKKQTGNQVLPKNSLPQPNKAGGWVLRYSKEEDGNYTFRDKVNYPTDHELNVRLSNIVKVTAPEGIKSNTIDMYDARLDVTNPSGKVVVFTIGCTKLQSMELL